MGSNIKPFPGRDAAVYLRMKDGDFVKVAGARTAALVLNNNPIDVTHADSDGFRELFGRGGIQQMDVTLDGFVTNQIGFRRLRRFAFVRKDVVIQYRTFTNEGWEAACFPASLNMTGAYNDAETFQVVLQSTGTITVKIDATLYRSQAEDQTTDESDLQAFTESDEVGT